MRTILVLTCCLALTAVVRAEDEADKTKTSEKVVKTKAVKTQVHSGQLKTNTNTLPAVQSTTNVQTGNNAQFKKQKNWHANNFKTGTDGTSAVKSSTTVHKEDPGDDDDKAQFKKKNWSNQNSVQTSADMNVQKGWDGKSKKWSQGGNSKFQGQVNANKSWKIKKFSVQNSPNSKIASMKFKQNYKIQGSQNWKGQKYWAFQNYQSQWHDKGWWHNHHNKIILISGGYYYWDSGYWYPAWGYDSAYEYYPYDGPIYGYNDLPPDQVVANVQAALQEQGYYQGEVDGLLGPLTRAALAGYQRDHGLYTTSAIDQPTLESLGMS
jgi:hypothetical protein